MAKITKIGFVGVGDISGIYLSNITGKFKELEIAGVCDLVRAKAEAAAQKYNIPKVYNDMHELFADPEVDIVLNITRPNEHYGVSRAALEAGKPVYSEKPLAATLEQGRELVELAKQKGLWLGGAPDTFLGAAVQGARKLIDDGAIGDPVGCSMRMMCRGHESWHPDPEFYYKAPGGGPMLDMGPYYISAIVQLLGPIASVQGMVRATFAERTITSKRLSGTKIEVTIPTHQTALLRFASGAIGYLITTFDTVSPPELNNQIEIFGSKGNMIVPDPNGFGGDLLLSAPDFPREEGQAWAHVPSPYDRYHGNSRALGLADMAKAIETGRTPRASAAWQTLHVLEVLKSVQISSEQGREVQIQAPFERQPALPLQGEEGVLD